MYETALKYVTSFIVVFTAILLQTCKINQTETIAQGRNIYDGWFSNIMMWAYKNNSVHFLGEKINMAWKKKRTLFLHFIQT